MVRAKNSDELVAIVAPQRETEVTSTRHHEVLWSAPEIARIARVPTSSPVAQLRASFAAPRPPLAGRLRGRAYCREFRLSYTGTNADDVLVELR
jgi:hypothetical protein